jgi:hypothetical protein
MRSPEAVTFRKVVDLVAKAMAPQGFLRRSNDLNRRRDDGFVEVIGFWMKWDRCRVGLGLGPTSLCDPKTGFLPYSVCRTLTRLGGSGDQGWPLVDADPTRLGLEIATRVLEVGPAWFSSVMPSDLADPPSHHRG